MEEVLKILALTGFLGQNQDFDIFLQELCKNQIFQESDVKIISVCQDLDLDTHDWSSWIQKITLEIQAWANSEKVFAIGYSLGGRLLLSLLKQEASLFLATAFLSTSQGLADEQQKSMRWSSDLEWAERFLIEPWPQLMTAWNSQSVFQGMQSEPSRTENNYQRERLSKVMKIFSLSLQPNFESFIENCQIPQFWAVGEKDSKFVDKLLGLKRQKKIGEFHTEIISDSGHRILFDQPLVLATKVAAWAQLLSFYSKP